MNPDLLSDCKKRKYYEIIAEESLKKEEERMNNLVALNKKYRAEEFEAWEKFINPIKEKLQERWKKMTVSDILPDIKEKIMEEDQSPFGGRAYDSETYGDFIEENSIDVNMDINTFNALLTSCGFVEI